MQESPEEVLASCISINSALRINVVRRVCESIVAELGPIDSQEAGRIIGAAERAEEALFDLLNFASSYGHCTVAGVAIDNYGSGRSV